MNEIRFWDYGMIIYNGFVFFGDVHSHEGSPKWMAYFMDNSMNMDDLGIPLFQETSM